MACHTTTDATKRRLAVPAEIALPPDELMPRVDWDPVEGRFVIEPPAAANDDQVGQGLVRMPAATLWRLGVAPEDADAIMRSLAGWLALFVAGGSALAHAWR